MLKQGFNQSYSETVAVKTLKGIIPWSDLSGNFPMHADQLPHYFGLGTTSYTILVLGSQPVLVYYSYKSFSAVCPSMIDIYW